MTNSGILVPREVFYYAAQECEWQQSGELSVAWMLDAWIYISERKEGCLTEKDILRLGALVEPKKNENGYRKVGVRVGWDVKMIPSSVPDAMEYLILHQPAFLVSQKDATKWFRQYEEIHPFVDGNGRTGTLLYNWMLGTLHLPVHVPNLWNDPRR